MSTITIHSKKPLLWKLSEHWEDYEHSSAKFYVKNICDGFVPLHYEELN